MNEVPPEITIGDVIPYLLTTIAVLVSVIVWFYKQAVKREEKTEAKLEQTEKRYHEVGDKIVDLSSEIGELRGRQEGVEQIAKEVIEAVVKIKPQVDDAIERGIRTIVKNE